MAQKDRADQEIDRNSLFPDNETKEISPEDVRDYETTVADSNFNLIDDDASNVSFSSPSYTATDVGGALNELKASGGAVLLEGTVEVGNIGTSGSAPVTGGFSLATKTIDDISTRVVVSFTSPLSNSDYIPNIVWAADTTAGNQAFQATTFEPLSRTINGFAFKVSERTSETQDLTAYIQIVQFNG